MELLRARACPLGWLSSCPAAHALVPGSGRGGGKLPGCLASSGCGHLLASRDSPRPPSPHMHTHTHTSPGGAAPCARPAHEVCVLSSSPSFLPPTLGPRSAISPGKLSLHGRKELSSQVLPQKSSGGCLSGEAGSPGLPTPPHPCRLAPLEAPLAGDGSPATLAGPASPRGGHWPWFSGSPLSPGRAGRDHRGRCPALPPRSLEAAAPEVHLHCGRVAWQVPSG